MASAARVSLRLSIIGIFAVVGCGVAGCRNDRSDPPDRHDSSKSSNGVAEGERGKTETIITVARFEERAIESGVQFTYRNGEEAGHFSIVESLGGGIALFDYDLDGQLDLFVPGGGKYDGRTMLGLSPALFRNESVPLQPKNWRFQNVTTAAGVGVSPYYSHGASVADYNNDGFPDVLVTGYGGLVLFRNLGDGTFAEEAHSLGLNDKLWSSSAAWGDIDGDGNLDLYVVHYANWSWDNHPVCHDYKGRVREVCPPRTYQPLPDTLYLSNGDGTFRDESRKRGLKAGKGLGVVMADLDLDGRLDIYVTNDTEPNFLYQNAGSEFKEIGLLSGTSRSDAGTPNGSMGTDVGDFNGDGLPDIWVANYEREAHSLYRNDGNFNFTHVSQNHGITALGGLYVGWGTVFFDFDRDGDEDLFVSNGHVIRYPRHSSLRQKPLLLENRDGKRFVNVAPSAGTYATSNHMGRGVAMGDIDNDGDLDLAVCHTNEPLSLLSNESKNNHGWLSVRLIGTKSSRDPIGAVLFLETTAGRQMRQVKGGGSYASTNDFRVFFGLGKSEIKRLEIRWPSGKKQLLDNVSPNRFMTVVEQP